MVAVEEAASLREQMSRARARIREMREMLLSAQSLDHAADAVSLIIAEGVEKAMAAFNRRAPGSNKEEE